MLSSNRRSTGRGGCATGRVGFRRRGGFRGLLLDDAGEVDGIRHVDTFAGPYAGLGLTF